MFLGLNSYHLEISKIDHCAWLEPNLDLGLSIRYMQAENDNNNIIRVFKFHLSAKSDFITQWSLMKHLMTGEGGSKKAENHLTSYMDEPQHRKN